MCVERGFPFGFSGRPDEDIPLAVTDKFHGSYRRDGIVWFVLF